MSDTPESDAAWAAAWDEGGCNEGELLDKMQELERQRDELLKVLRAARSLISAKGRHNTELGYENLRKAIAKIKEPSQ